MTDTVNADQAAVEPSVAQNTSEGADFVASILRGQNPMAQPPLAPQPVQPSPMPVPPPVQPAVPQPPAAPVPQPVQPVPPAPPVQQPPAQPVPVQPAPVVQTPAPLDYTQRYAPQGSAPLDLAPLPDLPPEPVIPQSPDGQQIPNAAFAAMRSGYGQMRHMANDFRNKYNQLVEDTKKFQGEKAEFATQLNAKDAEIKSLRDELGRIDLSRSPEFQEKYDAPLRAATDEVVKVLLANGMQQNDAVALARDVVETDDPQSRPEKLANLPAHVQGMILYQAQEADKLWNARVQALNDWKQSADGLAAVAARGSAIIDAQRTQRLADDAIRVIKGLPPEKGLPPAFQVTEPGFVADRDAKEQQFRSWVQNAPEDQKMAAMFEGFMAPKTYEMVDNVFRENLQLKQMLYARTRVDAPPIAAMRMPAPNLRPGVAVPAQPPQPPQPPTVQQNGWSVADSGTTAQNFAQQLMDSMRGQAPLPVL